MKILLADSNEASSSVMRNCLAREGFVVDLAAGENELLDRCGEINYDVVLVNASLTRVSGFGLFKELRESGCKGVIISLLDSVEPAVKIQALNQGADDCLAQPFLFMELVARLRAHARRQGVQMKKSGTLLKVSPFKVDVSKREVQRGNRLIQLTRKEFDLLVQLLRHPGHVLSPYALSENAGLSTIGDFANTVCVHIKNLRSKIDVRGKRSFIRTERGCGYALNCRA